MPSQLTAILITLNEERNIGRAIASLQGVADEVIVVDSFSADKTPEIVRSSGAKLVQKEWMGYSATKNFANSLATHSYILSIDADEALNEELKKNIIALKKNGLNGVYSANRMTNYLGKWIRHSGWYPDWKVRIFPKAETKWVGEFVHEELEFSTPQKVTRLGGILEHYSYYSYADHRARADKYSLLTAKKMCAAGKSAGVLEPYISAAGRFVAMYFIKLGFLDGWKGFKIAQISAASNILKYKELRRLSKNG